jgi:hypothetical protein
MLHRLTSNIDCGPSRSGSRSQKTLAAAICCATLLIACGDASPNSEDDKFTGAQGSTLFPNESLQDWVTYADHVAVYTVVAEREMPLDAEEKESGEGYAGKLVTLRIDRTLWSAEAAPALPERIEMQAVGWLYRNGQREPTTARDSPSVSVGNRCLAPLAQVEFDVGPEWWPLTPAAQLPLEGSHVGRAGWVSPHGEALAGESVDEIEARIKRQPPDPASVKYADLRPQDRIGAVLREKAEGSTP